MARRLAAQIGEADVEALWQSLTPEQMDEWWAYDEKEGLGLHKLITVLARVGSLICLSLGRDIPESHFIPGSEAEAVEPLQPVDVQIQAARAIAASCQ